MAIKTEVNTTLVDDLDGTMDATVKTRRFATDVEMELSDENYAKVALALDEILGKGRSTRKPPTVRAAPKNGSRPGRARSGRIKKWVAEHPELGLAVPARGRHSKEVEAAYVAATGDAV
jgi:hypothetical protein